jgi:hypothetical protein
MKTTTTEDPKARIEDPKFQTSAPDAIKDDKAFWNEVPMPTALSRVTAVIISEIFTCILSRPAMEYFLVIRLISWSDINSGIACFRHCRH